MRPLRSLSTPTGVSCTLVAVLFFAAPIATASDLWVSASLASYHLKRDRDRNETNRGFGFELTQGDHSGALCYYYNSFRRDTVYASYGYRPLRWGAVSAGGLVGVATGYSTPLIAAGVVSIEGKRFGANVMLVPPIGDYGGLVGIQLKWTQQAANK